MTGTTLPPETWYGAASGYLAMGMAMMVPMMMPSLVPMLMRYRRSVRGADGIRLHGLTVLVGPGYFVVWALFGAAAWAAGAGVRAVEARWETVGQWPPVAAGVVLLAIGMTDLVAMASVALAISAERLAPVPRRVARVAGVAILLLGVLTIARAQPMS